MTIQFSIPADHLKALSMCAAKKDVRYYLCGVAFDFTGRYPVAVATDGHRLLCVKLEYPLDKAPSEFKKQPFIVPIDSLQAITLTKHKGADIQVSLYALTASTAGNTCGSFELQRDSGAEAGELIDGRYPDWRRVKPSTVSGEVAHYNPFYIGEFGKIAELFGLTYPNFGYNGLAPALIGLTDEAFGVLMPYRNDKAAPSVPHWAD